MLAVALAGCSTSVERVYTGQFGPDDPVSLGNLTIADGRFDVGYRLEVLLVPRGAPVRIACTIVDTSGRIGFFDGLARTLEPGRWTTLTADGSFDLPELTLGLRCAPDDAATFDLIVREAVITAVPS